MWDNTMISNRDRRKRNWAARKFLIKENFNAFCFCAIFLTYWIYFILFIGWRHYLFKPQTYLIRAGDILLDIENHNGPGHKAHRFWWSRINCNAARDAAALNAPDTIVSFTLRTHPIFLDNEILTVRSKGYNQRVWKED